MLLKILLTVTFLNLFTLITHIHSAALDFYLDSNVKTGIMSSS
jgi:hypothetical protein